MSCAAAPWLRLNLVRLGHCCQALCQARPSRGVPALRPSRPTGPRQYKWKKIKFARMSLCGVAREGVRGRRPAGRGRGLGAGPAGPQGRDQPTGQPLPMRCGAGRGLACMPPARAARSPYQEHPSASLRRSSTSNPPLARPDIHHLLCFSIPERQGKEKHQERQLGVHR